MSGEPGTEEGSVPGQIEGESSVKLYPCQFCGTTNSAKYGILDTPIKLASHTKYECEKAKAHKKAEGLKEAGREIDAAREVAGPAPTQETAAPEPDDLTPRQRVAMYGAPELEKLKRRSLEKFMSAAPNVGKKLSDWILQQWDLDANIREDPNYLNDLLRDAGVPANMSYRAVNLVMSLDDEMRDVLEQRHERFRIQRREPYRRESYPDRDYGRQDFERRPPIREDRFTERSHLRRVSDGVYEDNEPYYGRQPPPMSSSDEASWKMEREIDRATRPLLEKIDKLAEDLKESRQPKPEQTVEIWRPKLNEQGEILTDAAGKPVLERISAPASMANQFMPHEDPELVALKKMEYYKSLFAPQGASAEPELTLEKVREVIRQEKEQLTPERVASIIDEKMKSNAPPVNPEFAKMQNQLDVLNKELGETKDKMTQERFDALKKQLDDTRGMIQNMQTGEFKEDSMRLLSKSLDKATEMMSTRKPLEKALDRMMPALPEIPEGSQPGAAQKTVLERVVEQGPPKVVPPEAKKGPLSAMQKLEAEGFVVKK